MCNEASRAPARRTGRRGGSSSEGRLGDDIGLIGEHGLLESEHGAGHAEGRERGCVGDVVGGDDELGVEAVNEVEAESPKRHGRCHGESARDLTCWQ
jgi:hypothetical protein